MCTPEELQEYLDEIRQEVCSRCVERPEGGPPCGPLGKPCGVEMHLPQLIDAVHKVQSDWLGPYVDCNRQEICAKCPIRCNSYHCPCPMETLVGLLVPAVETVDQRHQMRERELAQLVDLWGD